MKQEEPLIGRHNELGQLDEIMADPAPALVAIYGRRRVGKTFLVRRATAKSLRFELTGVKDANLREQLENFSSALAAASAGKITGAPRSWHQAFDLLAEWFGTLPRREKHVLFMDELPWLASPRSRFLQALDHFWNSWASRQPNLVLIVCGSAASWMIRKLLHDRGGLHNRVTHRIRLDPFTLAETREFLSERRISLGDLQIAELYMAMGGIPHYLKQVRRGESTAQAIDRICFSADGLLRNEFDLLIDRADGCINLCEMKFSEGPFVIDKPYAATLRQRRDTFRRETGSRKSLFLTFVTTADVKRNGYGLELVDASVTLDALFHPTG